jgi:RNA polymerase sigma-70 factor, ECF subfamily
MQSAGMSDLAQQLGALRPELHRYCARMAGSVADGEDLVQDAFERALAAPDPPREATALRRWLFRIAHNRAIDAARAYGRRHGVPLADEPPDDAPAADDALAERDATRAAIARFLELPPLPRSCVVQKDVLGHSLDEIAADTEQSLAAVKAALHRGRAKLRALGEAATREPPRGAPSPVVARYAALFNARDWDGVRALLAEDVMLNLPTRVRLRGVDRYFTNYAAFPTWRVSVAWLDGREVLRVEHPDRPVYFVALELRGDQVIEIRDYIHVPYIGTDARFTAASP